MSDSPDTQKVATLIYKQALVVLGAIATKMFTFVGVGGAYAAKAVVGSYATVDGLVFGAGLNNDLDNQVILAAISIEDSFKSRLMTYEQILNTRNGQVHNTPVPPSQITVAFATNLLKAANDYLTAITGASAFTGTVQTIDLPSPPADKTVYTLTSDGNVYSFTTAGETADLVVDPDPGYPLNWETSDATKISLSRGNGITNTVTAVGKGSANITVGPFTDGAEEYLTVCLYMDPEVTYTINPPLVNLDLGHSWVVPVLPAIPEPTGDWESSDPSVATVDTMGRVTAVAVGSTTISVRGASVTVVVPPVPITNDITNLRLSGFANGS